MIFKLLSKLRNTSYHIKTAKWDVLKAYHSILFGNLPIPYFKLLKNSWIYGASFEDFYRFRFFEKNDAQKKSYITTSLRHELTRQVNDDVQAKNLKDKIAFKSEFSDYLGRCVFSYDDILILESKPPKRLVIKPIHGQAGNGILFPDKEFMSWKCLIEWMEAQKFYPDKYIYEEYLIQHPQLMKLNPTTLNTLRVVTFLNENKVEIWGSYLRMGIGCKVDNFATGGIAAYIDSNGIITREAVSKNPTLTPFSNHPLTNEKIVGFEIPCYDQVINLVIKAAHLTPNVKSIGWDIAITENGPCLMEGNDNWCCAILQMPCGEGKRFFAEQFCDMKLVYD